MRELHWLAPGDPPDAFPDPASAMRDPNGLLAIGGDLDPERLLAAYRRGIFPWYDAQQPILWWSPDPRAVLWPQDFHVSRSLRRTLRRNRFTTSVDRAFAAVIAECAEIRAHSGTWITPEMQHAYLELHALGHAHSVETWEGDQLVGGLYGVNVGRVFFGESMFSRRDDASKAALAALVQIARELGVELIDCQLASAHLSSLGSRDITRTRFLELLGRFCSLPSPGPWRRGRAPTDVLT